MKFHITRFSVKSRFKEWKGVDGGHSLNRDFTVLTYVYSALITANAITSDSIRLELTENIINAFYVMPQSVVSTTLFTFLFSGFAGLLGLISTVLASLTAFAFLSLAQISSWQAINAAGKMPSFPQSINFNFVMYIGY